MLTLILGGCGTGKSTKLMERMKADIVCGKDVLVLVPEQFSFEAEKKLYGFLGASDFNRIQTFSFATLSRHIFQCYGQNARADRYASDREKLVLLYQAVRTAARRRELQVLARRSESADFAEELLALFTKIRKAGITSQQLLDAAVQLGDGLGEKTSDIAMILVEYDRILTEHGLYDSLTDLTEAAMIANVQSFFEGKELYIDEFDSFTGDQYAMLDVMLAQAAHVTAAIRTDEPDAAISPIFEGGNRTYHELLRIAKEKYRIPTQMQFCETYQRSSHADLCAVSTQLLRPAAKKAEYSGHVHVMGASDPAAEAEYIGATICQLLSTDNTLRCRNIAIAVKSLDDYGSVLERALTRYSLPYYISSAKSVLYTDLMRHFLSLLAILADGKWDTEHILRYLKTPFSNYSAVSVSMLEHYCFTWGIAKEDWLIPFYEEGTESADRAEPFGGESLEKIRLRFVTEIQGLEKACCGKSVKAVCSELYAFLCRKRKSREAFLETLDILQKREFTTLWNMLMEMMDTVVSCSGEQVLSFGELYEIFRLMISAGSFATPPQTLDSIQIVEAQTTRLNAPSVVFVPGVSENVFPGEVSLGGMFTRQELERLKDCGITISRMLFELYSDERLIVHKICSAPSEQLYLSYPMMNAAGESVGPSIVIRQIETMFSDHPALTVRETEIPLTYYVRTPASAYYHFVRNLRNDTPELAAMQQILQTYPDYAARIAKLVDTDAAPQHHVAPESMKQLLGTQISLSPSKIEMFYNCPFQYFCSHCLRLYAPEKNALSNSNVGNFAHYCLEQILRKYDVEQFAALTVLQLQEEIHALSEEFSAHNFSDATRRDGRFQINYSMSGMGLLKVLQHMQKEMRDSRFAPTGFEVVVNSEENNGMIPPLTLRDGSVQCVGKIDRVDCCRDGGASILRVVDYKTGSRIFAPEKLADGLDMQMLIYLFALRHSGLYPDSVPGGVLYMPSGQPKLKNYYDRDKNKAADEILDEYYQMKGLLLDTAAPLMEPEIAAACTPILNETSGSLYAVNASQMEKLEAHVTGKICDMADALYAGEIAPAPYLNEPCGYCGCADLCGMEIQKPVTLHKDERLQAIAEVFGESEETAEKEEND